MTPQTPCGHPNHGNTDHDCRPFQTPERDPAVVQRWGDEHSARNMPIGTVIYDDADDLFTVKAGPGRWITYSQDRLPFADPLNDRDIDGDRGDQIVGRIEL